MLAIRRVSSSRSRWWNTEFGRKISKNAHNLAASTRNLPPVHGPPSATFMGKSRSEITRLAADTLSARFLFQICHKFDVFFADRFDQLTPNVPVDADFLI